MSFPYLAALSWRATMTEYASTKSFHRGMMGMTEDGSLWRLCKTGDTLHHHHKAAINAYAHLTGVTGDSAESALSVAIVAGDTDYTMADATNSRAADYYKWGYSFQPREIGDNMKYIWKSDAEVSDTYKIYVTSPFAYADALGNTIHTYPCPWGNVQAPTDYSSGHEHFVAVPNFAPVTSGKFFWGQVRGPHWMLTLGTYPGAVSEDRHVHFHTGGDIDMLNHGVAAHSPQIAGYLMFSGNYGDVLIYLQIE